MSRDITPFGLRMPTELKTLVEKAAAANGRSINAEVVTRLQESFAASDVTSGALQMDVDCLADAIAERVADKLSARQKLIS